MVLPGYMTPNGPGTVTVPQGITSGQIHPDQVNILPTYTMVTGEIRIY